ncbi:MAG: alpha/beta hydrolase [Aquihabitans sp.]
MGKRRTWGIVAAAVLGVVASGCSSSASDGTAAPDEKATTTVAETTTTAKPIDWPKPAFVEGECPMDLTDEVIVEVTCGTVEVPENRTDPHSKMISLAVAKLHSNSDTPREDPVVQLEGGPGFSSLDSVGGYSKSAILDERDYYIWDQRGTGYSTPNLDCTETNEAIWGIFATTDDPKDEGVRVDDSLRECRDRLKADGVDLSGYNTPQNAADLADLRVALGIDEWNLRGISYGSALAIETVRSHPEGVRSVLLDSIVVPDEPFGAVDRGKAALRAFGEFKEACAAQPSCDEKYGPIDELMAKAAAQLDEEPYVGEVEDPATGEPRHVEITGADMYAGMFRAMYDETLIPVLPTALTQIASGDYGIVEQLVQESVPFVTDQVEGMTASVDCADRLPLLDPDSLDPFVEEHPELGSLVYLAAAESGCDEWGVPANGGDFNTLLTVDDTSDVPIILMAGQFDPVTPPEGSRRVADALGQDLLLFPNAGHGAVTSSDCARGIWFAFLDDPSQQPDASCLEDEQLPAFA